MATIAAPLWELRVKEGKEAFKWLPEHEESMKRVKRTLSTKALAFFNVKWETEVCTDASPRGLSAVLLQINPKDEKDRKVITYISRKLTSVETRYSQVEKEALAVVWACERLYLYLIGRNFRVITDNRAVKLMFSNPKAKLPARIERWGLRLMSFDIEFVFRPGKTNVADYLSRHPIGQVPKHDGDHYINSITDHAVPKAMSRHEIAEESKKDPLLASIRKAIRKEKLSIDERKLIGQVNKLIPEMSITEDDIVLRGTRIVVPETLQERALRIAHEGHLGINKTKELLRSKVWFPGIDKAVYLTIRSCLACQLNSREVREPIKSTAIPSKIWDELAMDFLGLPNGRELGVIIDKCSRFPVAFEVTTTAAAHVTPKLDELFSILGIPSEIMTDNGPPFNGREFAEFCEHFGIRNRKVTPEWPHANGLAEGFMKNLAKVIRSAQVEGREWKIAMNEFLRNYRDTPHPTTLMAPSEMMFKRCRSSRLPIIDDVDTTVRVTDEKKKAKSARYSNKRQRAHYDDLNIGDTVFAKQKRTNKWMTRFGSAEYEVKTIKGSMITAVDRNGRELTRDRSWFIKKYGKDENLQENREIQVEQQQPEPELLKREATQQAVSPKTTVTTEKPKSPESTTAKTQAPTRKSNRSNFGVAPTRLTY